MVCTAPSPSKLSVQMEHVSPSKVRSDMVVPCARIGEHSKLTKMSPSLFLSNTTACTHMTYSTTAYRLAGFVAVCVIVAILLEVLRAAHSISNSLSATEYLISLITKGRQSKYFQTHCENADGETEDIDPICTSVDFVPDTLDWMRGEQETISDAMENVKQASKNVNEASLHAVSSSKNAVKASAHVVEASRHVDNGFKKWASFPDTTRWASVEKRNISNIIKEIHNVAKDLRKTTKGLRLPW